MQKIKAHYDVIVIGAGIGGLTAGALLSKYGLSVAIVEKEPHVGGYLAGYQKKGFKFDTAIHWLNQCDDKGVVNNLYKVFGTDYPKCKPLVNIQRFKSETTDYLLTNNPEELKQQWLQDFEKDKEGINKFFAHAKKIARSFLNYKKIFRVSVTMNWIERMQHVVRLIKFARPFLPFISYNGEKTDKGLSKFFSEDKLKGLFLSQTDLLACLVPFSWASNGDYQCPPKGGGQVIPKWLSSVAKSNGGDIFLNTSVKQVLVDGKKTKGVSAIFRNKEEIKITSDFIIAACDLEKLYKEFLPLNNYNNRIIKKIEQAELYASSVTISIALNCPTEQLGFGEEMIHLFKDNVSRELQNCGDPQLSSLTILAPSIRDSTLAPEGCGTLVIFMSALLSQYDSWKTEAFLKRGEAYNEFKMQVSEQLIKRVEAQLGIDIQRHILFVDVATPITHWRYTGNKLGTMMGAKPGKKNMKAKVAQYTTGYGNMFIGGQWAELGGGVPIATRAGVNAALLVLKNKDQKKQQQLIAALKHNGIT